MSKAKPKLPVNIKSPTKTISPKTKFPKKTYSPQTARCYSKGSVEYTFSLIAVTKVLMLVAHAYKHFFHLLLLLGKFPLLSLSEEDMPVDEDEVRSQ